MHAVGDKEGLSRATALMNRVRSSLLTKPNLDTVASLEQYNFDYSHAGNIFRLFFIKYENLIFLVSNWSHWLSAKQFYMASEPLNHY